MVEFATILAITAGLPQHIIEGVSLGFLSLAAFFSGYAFAGHQHDTER